MILAIDPGPTESAWVLWDGTVQRFGKNENSEVLNLMRFLHRGRCLQHVVCERIRSYGMPAGAELFETCEWSGRYQQVTEYQSVEWHWLTRKEVKMHLCGSPRAKDGNIRQALIDRFGRELQKPVSAETQRRNERKGKTPRPQYILAEDLWAALGVAVTWWDQRNARAAGAA